MGVRLDLDKALQLGLLNGGVDGLVVDLGTAFYMRDGQLENYDTPEPEGTIVGIFPRSGAGEHFGIVLEKGSALTPCVNEAIAAIKADGQLQTIYDTWIGGQGGVPVFDAPAPANSPEWAVNNVINAMKAKNFSAIPAMICAARRDAISAKLDITTSLASSAPGLDRRQLLDAMTFDFKDLTVTRVSETGDAAVVAVKGSLVITLDPAKARDIVKAILSGQGQTPTDAQIDALLPTMVSALGKGTAIDSQGDVVEEGGTWLLCSDLTAASSSGSGVVGDYRCLDLALAVTRIESDGFVVGSIFPESPPRDDTWLVKEQSPSTGQRVADGTVVDLLVVDPSGPCA